MSKITIFTIGKDGPDVQFMLNSQTFLHDLPTEFAQALGGAEGRCCFPRRLGLNQQKCLFESIFNFV